MAARKKKKAPRKKTAAPLAPTPPLAGPAPAFLLIPLDLIPERYRATVLEANEALAPAFENREQIAATVAKLLRMVSK